MEISHLFSGTREVTISHIVVISFHMLGKLEELEMNPNGIPALAPSHWNSVMWARFMHPLAEPWIPEQRDADLSTTHLIKRRYLFPLALKSVKFYWECLYGTII